MAVVHDWLTAYAGSEKVLEQILLLFPQAELFTLVDHLPKSHRSFLSGRAIHTSFLQDLPFSAHLFRPLLWLLPVAIESLDLSGFDLVISSSHAVAKGVLTGPDQLHICYCHSPIRYAWDCQHEYLRQRGCYSGLGAIYARWTLHRIRIWDARTPAGVNHFIANSNFIARRIAKVYARSAVVIHPPVETDKFRLIPQKSDYYVTASRLVPYKRVDLIVEAFQSLPNRRLIVIGDGPQMKACRKLARGNVDFLGYVPDDQLREVVGYARAFIFAAEEDFGISVVEAQASGTPVLCYGKGGALDSVVDQKTGLHFSEQTAANIVDAVRRFEARMGSFDPLEIRAHAQRFNPQQFQQQFQRFVTARWREHDAYLHGANQTAEAGLAMSA